MFSGAIVLRKDPIGIRLCRIAVRYLRYLSCPLRPRQGSLMVTVPLHGSLVRASAYTPWLNALKFTLDSSRIPVNENSRD